MSINDISESLLLLLLLGSCCVGHGVGSVGIESRGAEPASELPRFEDNLYAQLLMRATAGSLFPADAYSPEDIFYMQARGEPVVPSRKYKHAARENGLDWPSVGHTMIGHLRLQNLYEAIRMLHNSGVPGDVLEAGVWRGGASIFAAGVLRHAQSGRHVWVCDSFQGFDLKAWDGDSGWSVLNSIVAVSLDDVRQNFENYGLLDEDKIHFVKGFFVDSLPEAAVEKIALLRLDGDLFSSTSDILYNLYGKISIGGVIIVDDFGIEACQRAVLDFRRIHGIDDDLVPIDASGAVWWIKKERTTPRSEVYRRMLSALADAVAAGQYLRIGLEWLSPHNRCHISGPCDADPLGYKSVAGKHSTWDDSREAYQNLIVADNEGACHARARAWHAVCNNSAASSVTATFLPRGSSRIYPPISSTREPSQEEASNLGSGSQSTPSLQQTAALDCSLLLDQQILVFDPDLRFDRSRSLDLSARANEMWVAGTIVDDMLSDTEKLPSVCMVQYEDGEQEYLDLWWASLRWL